MMAKFIAACLLVMSASAALSAERTVEALSRATPPAAGTAPPLSVSDFLRQFSKKAKLTPAELDKGYALLDTLVAESLTNPKDKANLKDTITLTVFLLRADPSQDAGDAFFAVYEAHPQEVEAALRSFAMADRRILLRAMRNIKRFQKKGSG